VQEKQELLDKNDQLISWNKKIKYLTKKVVLINKEIGLRQSKSLKLYRKK